jgi:hypothetical protein
MATRKKSPYGENDYNSNDGMLTTIWGPSQWHFLHTMSFNYPVNPTQKDKMNYRAYVLSLRNVLPCGKCRANLRHNFKKLPLNMSNMASRQTFSKYIFDLHELINEMLHKKSGLTYEEVRDTYENFRSRCVVPKTRCTATATAKAHRTTATRTQRNTKAHTKKESGCTRPLYGKKAKCLLRIVPQEEKTPTFEVDSKCVKRSE